MTEIKEQKIISNTPEAIAYRNMNRPRVDKFFRIKYKSKTKEKTKKFDNLARQTWREIIIVSNKM